MRPIDGDDATKKIMEEIDRNLILYPGVEKNRLVAYFNDGMMEAVKIIKEMPAIERFEGPKKFKHFPERKVTGICYDECMNELEIIGKQRGLETYSMYDFGGDEVVKLIFLDPVTSRSAYVSVDLPETTIDDIYEIAKYLDGEFNGDRTV